MKMAKNLTTFRLFLLLGVFASIQLTCMARDVSSDILEEMKGAIMEAKTCHDWGYGNCTEHAGCSACKWRFRWPTIEFCTSNTTATKLPKSTFCLEGFPIYIDTDGIGLEYRCCFHQLHSHSYC